MTLLNAIAELIICYLFHRNRRERLWWDRDDRYRCLTCGLLWRR